MELVLLDGNIGVRIARVWCILCFY